MFWLRLQILQLGQHLLHERHPAVSVQPAFLLQWYAEAKHPVEKSAHQRIAQVLSWIFSFYGWGQDMQISWNPYQKVAKGSHFTTSLCNVFTACRRFAHLLAKKDVGCPETKKDLLRKVKSAISSTAERFSGNMQNVRLLQKSKSSADLKKTVFWICCISVILFLKDMQIHWLLSCVSTDSIWTYSLLVWGIFSGESVSITR